MYIFSPSVGPAFKPCFWCLKNASKEARVLHVCLNIITLDISYSLFKKLSRGFNTTRYGKEQSPRHWPDISAEALAGFPVVTNSSSCCVIFKPSLFVINRLVGKAFGVIS